jgi:hypothetical protein
MNVQVIPEANAQTDTTFIESYLGEITAAIYGNTEAIYGINAYRN